MSQEQQEQLEQQEQVRDALANDTESLESLEPPRKLPKRMTAVKAMQKIKEIHGWENCREDSEQFKAVARAMDEEFERELGAFDADENNEDVDDEDSEFSQSESESYESSFIDDDEESEGSDSSCEWTPRRKKPKVDRPDDTEAKRDVDNASSMVKLDFDEKENCSVKSCEANHDDESDSDHEELCDEDFL